MLTTDKQLIAARNGAYRQSFAVILDLGTNGERLVTKVFQTAAKLLVKSVPNRQKP